MSPDVHFDFAVLLTGLTLFTGVFWALDKWVLAPKRHATLQPGELDRPSAFIDFCRSFFPVIAIVLGLRSFIVEPFRIPSGSMIPTLLVGDFILVNKFAYGLRDPVFHHKFLEVGEPKRGDVFVFRWPVDTSKDFIKRVIGLPGDRIAYRDKTLYINGEKMALEESGIFASPSLPPPSVAMRFSENLTGVEHFILTNPDRPSDDSMEFTVPEGRYFAMGDNRDGSDDSRRWGYVPKENLVGKAFFIWMSWDAVNTRVDFTRIGNQVK